MGAVTSLDSLKLCSDGTWRLSREGFVVITLGILQRNPHPMKEAGWVSRHGSEVLQTCISFCAICCPVFLVHRAILVARCCLAPCEASGLDAKFPVSFFELVVGVASSESSESYMTLNNSLVDVGLKVLGINLVPHVLALHADLHLGLEKARASIFKASRRQSDWSHVIGANRNRQPLLTEQLKANEEVKRLLVWRKGLFKNLSERLQKKDVLETLEETFHCSRFMARGVFSLVMRECLAFLEAREELNAAHLIRKHYLYMTVPWLFIINLPACHFLSPRMLRTLLIKVSCF